MARLQVEIDGNAKGLTTSLGQANSSLDKFSREAAKVSSQTQGFTKSVGNANGVAMEFNRIIQDAPFGMMGIGNNIQQLTANWATYAQQTRAAAAEAGKSVTTMALLKGAVGTILSPVNLLTLGIAAATSAWTFYTMWSQRSNKATKEAKDSIEDLIEGLSNQSRVMVQAAESSGKEVAQLRTLYSITQDTTIATNERKDAAQRLIKQYPDLFKKIGEEGILLGKAKTAYDNLTTSIIATAKAQAAYGMISDKAREQLIIDETNKSLRDRVAILDKTIQREESLLKVGGATTATGEAMESGQVSSLNKLYSEREEIQKNITKNLLDRASRQEEINVLEKQAVSNQTDIADGYGITAGKAKEAADKFDVYRDSLSQYDQKLYDIEKRYEEIFKQVKGTDLFGLAEANKEAEKLRANMERVLEITNLKIVNNENVTPQLSGVPSISPLINSAAGRKASRLPVFSDDEDEKLQKRISKLVEGGFRRGISGILDNIDDLGSNFYEVFNNVFSSLAGSINKIFTDVIATEIGNKFSDLLDSDDFKIGKLSTNVSKGIVAGAGIAGGLISSMSSKSSSVGQGLGGALSGAAAGMAFGPWGAAIGGVVGAISGIFGAKAARKQEKLQEEALKEQRKQTALLEYQNAKGWESNIIGQMTSQGIVNGFSRDATGQLTAKISGQDLLFVIERAGGKR